MRCAFPKNPSVFRGATSCCKIGRRPNSECGDETHPGAGMKDHRIEPLPGFTPTIGRLVAMLTHARQGLLSAVRDLSIAQLDHLHDARSNSIGALLAHAAAVEGWHQILTFEDRIAPEGD